MIRIIVYIGLIVLCFYVVIPGIGAFLVRNQWRRFRRQMKAASLRPFVSYKDVRSRQRFLGEFSFLGSLEAIQEDRIWIRNKKLSLSAEMHQCKVYLLPPQSESFQEGKRETNTEVLPDEIPKKISWNNIFTLPEGTKVFISGSLYLRDGRPCFYSEKENPLLLIIYDGPENTILRRSIRGGRQKNEYWNQFTPLSMIAGFFSLIIYAYVLYRNPMMRLPVMAALTGSLLPALVLLPPGILLFFAYRYFWKQGRSLRAERDLLLLPMRYFSTEDLRLEYKEIILPNSGPYGMKRGPESIDEALSFCTEGVKIRESTLFKKKRSRLASTCYIFGKPIGTAAVPRFGQPDNPMAEFILVPGNPAEISDECSRTARFYELLSGVCFITGLLVNSLLTVSLLHFIIK